MKYEDLDDDQQFYAWEAYSDYIHEDEKAMAAWFDSLPEEEQKHIACEDQAKNE